VSDQVSQIFKPEVPARHICVQLRAFWVLILCNRQAKSSSVEYKRRIQRISILNAKDGLNSLMVNKKPVISSRASTPFPELGQEH